MPMTSAERQRRHRDKMTGPTALSARTISEKVYRFLVKYPAQVQAVDSYMVGLAATTKRAAKVDQWSKDHTDVCCTTFYNHLRRRFEALERGRVYSWELMNLPL